MKPSLQAPTAPPAAFAWVGLGSAGRSAQTVATDQDNGLIYENVAAGRADEVRRWFSRLAEHVVAGLETCGFPRCAGNAIATNPDLLGTLDHWRALFERIISKSADKDLFEATIYFDFRCQFGRAALAARAMVCTLRNANRSAESGTNAGWSAVASSSEANTDRGTAVRGTGISHKNSRETARPHRFHCQATRDRRGLRPRRCALLKGGSG